MIKTKQTRKALLAVESFNEIRSQVRESQLNRMERSFEPKQSKSISKKTIIIAFIIFAIVAAVVVFADVAKENGRFDYAFNLERVEVVVKSGDTIDGIAAANPVKGLNAHELGWVIGEINKDSENVSTPLMPGDKILIPVEK